jgi:hypothetical protein
MKLIKALILAAGLGFFAISAYADHRGGYQFEARYEYHDSGSHHGHNKHYKKHPKQGYDKHYKGYYQHHNDHSYNKHYYARHEHSRHCGHRYQPAFNSRVNVIFGL